MPSKLKRRLSKYSAKDGIRLNIEKEWPSAKAFGTILPNYMITPDSTFTRLKTGAGAIEYFNEPYINYGSEDRPNIILNPNGNIPTLLYSPLNNSLDDVKLDLLHHYRYYDPVYLDLLQDYTSTLNKSEILWNSLLGDLFRNKYPDTYNKHWEEWDYLVNNTPDNSLYITQGIDGSLRNLLAKEETIKKSNYAPREEAILQYLNTPKAQQAFNNIQLYLESNRLPEVTVTPNSHSDGGSLKSPLDWNELSMKEKAAYIRMGVANGYKDINSIRLVYNEFQKGGYLYKGGGTKKNSAPPTEYIYDVLPRMLREAGLNVRVTSGYRKPGAVGTAGSRSWHPRHGAVDIVPQGKTTFEDIERVIYSNSAIYNYMLTNGFGLLDESGRTAASRAFMKQTGATGPHFHFGRDSKAVARYRNKMQLVLKGQPLPEISKNNVVITPLSNDLIRANTEGKTVYFKNPSGFNSIEQPVNNLIATIPTPAEPLLNSNNNTTIDLNSNIIPEKIPVNENIGLNMLNPVEVVAERPKPKMDIASTVDIMNSMYIPYEPILYPQPKTATERLAELNLELNTLLALDLENTILRNSTLGIYDNDLLKRKVLDLLFYRNMAANGGKLFRLGGDEDEIEKTLPTQVVTPRGNYILYTGNESSVPTIKDYFDAKANESRINAANHIIHLRIPNIPTVPSREFISVVSGIMGMSDEERIKRFGTADVETCIYTATSLFNDKGAKVSGNVTFNDDPLQFGFTPVSIGDIQEGDLMQFTANGSPTHSALVTGFNMNGEPVLSYSRGGTEEYGHYWDDELNKEVFKPTMAYDNEMNNVLNSFEGFDTYRYTGSDSQKLNWAKEYSNKFNIPYSDIYPEVLNYLYSKPSLVKSGSWAFGGPIVQRANHIYDGTSEPTLLMNDDEEDKIYNAQPVTLMMNVVASKPTVHWDGFNWIGYNDLGLRVTKGPEFNPNGANIIKDPLKFELARLALAAKKDINHTHAFAEDIRNLATGLVMAPAAAPMMEAAGAMNLASKTANIGKAIYNVGKPWVNNTLQFMSRPVSSIAKEVLPLVSKAYPWLESVDRGIWGTSGLLGMKNAYEGWLSGEKHWGNALAEGALSGLMLGEMSPAVKEGYNLVKQGYNIAEDASATALGNNPIVKRALEAAALTADINPLSMIRRYLTQELGYNALMKGDMPKDTKHLGNTLKYIFTGKGDSKNAYFAPEGFGFERANGDKDGYLRALLYGEEPGTDLTKLGTAADVPVGEHLQTLLDRGYKPEQIRVYSTNMPGRGKYLSPNQEELNLYIANMDYTSRAADSSLPTANGNFDAAGHRIFNVGEGLDVNQMELDFTDFNTTAYGKKWLHSNVFIDPFLKFGLKVMDRATTPIIVRTKWGSRFPSQLGQTMTEPSEILDSKDWLSFKDMINNDITAFENLQFKNKNLNPSILKYYTGYELPYDLTKKSWFRR